MILSSVFRKKPKTLNEPVAPIPEAEKIEFYTEGVNKAIIVFSIAILFGIIMGLIIRRFIK